MSAGSSRKGAAIVTGASQGIGRAIALKLARDGYAIAVNDIPARREDVEAIVADLAKTGRAIAVLGDVSREQDIKAMIARTVEEIGELEVFVANAGLPQCGTMDETTVEEWDRVFAVNVRGTFISYREASNQMIKQGKGGCIIGASSVAGKQGMGANACYSASKFAIRGLTQSAALELGKHGIRVNAYAPGAIQTGFLDTFDEAYTTREGKTKGQLLEELKASNPLGHLGTPEDIADLVSFLVSPAARYITGQSVICDGGTRFD